MIWCGEAGRLRESGFVTHRSIRLPLGRLYVSDFRALPILEDDHLGRGAIKLIIKGLAERANHNYQTDQMAARFISDFHRPAQPCPRGAVREKHAWPVIVQMAALLLVTDCDIGVETMQILHFLVASLRATLP